MKETLLEMKEKSIVQLSVRTLFTMHRKFNKAHCKVAKTCFVQNFRIDFIAYVHIFQILRKSYTSNGCLRCGNDKAYSCEGIYQI